MMPMASPIVDVHTLVLDFPALPLIVYVEPRAAILRAYVSLLGVALFALTVSGREIPLKAS